MAFDPCLDRAIGSVAEEARREARLGDRKQESGRLDQRLARCLRVPTAEPAYLDRLPQAN